MNAINETKLRIAMALHLQSGSHDSIEEGACVMEVVSYVAGEAWSDQPTCACPVISAFLRSWNDCLPDDATRDRLLKPLVPQLINTRSTKAVEVKRSYLALDWMVRVFTPKWLDLVPSLSSHAMELRNLGDIADMAGAVAAGNKVRAARAAAGDAVRDAAGDAARDAARAAARDAARAAAWAAVRDAVRDAARDAARAAAGDAARDAARAAAWAAAWDAAWDAAGDAVRDAARAAARAAAWDAARAAAWDAARAAAGDAAWDAAGDAARAAAWAAAGDAAGAAAWDAAGDALKPTTEWLQASALDLVTRMIEVRS